MNEMKVNNNEFVIHTYTVSLKTKSKKFNLVHLTKTFLLDISVLIAYDVLTV